MHFIKDTPFAFDKDYVRKHEIVKKDPYRYILTKKDFESCYSRKQRLTFTSILVFSYLYYSTRYKQELGLIRGLKLGRVFYYTTLPKAMVIALLSWPLGYAMFVDFDKKKLHKIAYIELMKFDPNWFTHDEVKYTLLNTPIYDSEDSKYGKENLLRGFYTYYQVPGWIRRIKERNTDIDKDLPPQYEFTPKPPRNVDMKKDANKIPKVLISRPENLDNKDNIL